MKVVYVLSSSMAMGGASKAFKSMLTGLMQRGVEPLAVIPGEGPISAWLREKHIPYLATTYRGATYPDSRTVKDWLLFVPRLVARQCVNYMATRRMVQWLRGQDVTLVHTNVGVVDIGYRASRQLRVPHVYHIREYADLDFGLHYFPSKKRFRQQLDDGSCYSICITKAIQHHHGQDGTPRSRVIYDGIRPALSAPAAAAPDKGYVLFAGRIEYTKGFDVLLKAYALCRKRGVDVLPLHVAGRVSEQPYSDELQQFVRDSQLTTKVSFLGERADVEDLMKHARVLVVASRHEGFGLCMPEAMFCGCLVIAYDAAGTHEQLENGLQRTGKEIALRYQSVEQLAALLEEVCAAPSAEYSEMTGRAFDVVNQLYTTEAHVGQVCDFYQKIVEQTLITK